MFDRLLPRVLGRLRFPQLFLLTAVVFVLDLVIPDAIPLVDEVLLGLVTLLLGSWRERKRVGEGEAEAGEGGEDGILSSGGPTPD